MNPLLNDIIPPLDGLKKSLEKADLTRVNGKVEQVVGLVIESTGPASSVGEVCWITPTDGGKPLLAEVVGFRQNRVLLMPLGDMRGLGPGSEVVRTGESFKISVGEALLGRVLDGMGMPIDGKGPLGSMAENYSIHRDPPPAMERRRITTPVAMGVRAIDAVLTVGEGQRMGIFAGSGVGKSTLLGMVACNTEADVNVIALVGERGREVKDFLERDLGEKGLARSVVIVATSDQPSLIRIQAALVATAVAEYFRDRGKKVMLMMDSITRFAMAQREVGLAIGEPPTTKGYTPSVFALLPKLLERAGTTSHQGSITGIYTILVEADDMNEPVADACRSILDGHVVLSRDLAAQNHYPAIDVLNSVSRVMRDIVNAGQLQAAGNIRSMLATYKSVEDLIAIGAYVKGSNSKVDQALAKLDSIQGFLRQSREDSAPWADTMQKLKSFFGLTMPKRFQFRLEQVLNLRKQVEETKIRELAMAKIRLLEAEKVLNDHLEKEKEFVEAFGDISAGGSFTADRALNYSEYKISLEKQEQRFRDRQNDWMLETERRRREAVKATRQRQLLENLKEKRRRAHAREVAAEEQKFLDEVSSIAYVRRERAKK